MEVKKITLKYKILACAEFVLRLLQQSDFGGVAALELIGQPAVHERTEEVVVQRFPLRVVQVADGDADQQDNHRTEQSEIHVRQTEYWPHLLVIRPGIFLISLTIKKKLTIFFSYFGDKQKNGITVCFNSLFYK
jgi:hypothetical protein